MRKVIYSGLTSNTEPHKQTTKERKKTPWQEKTQETTQHQKPKRWHAITDAHSENYAFTTATVN